VNIQTAFKGGGKNDKNESLYRSTKGVSLSLRRKGMTNDLRIDSIKRSLASFSKQRNLLNQMRLTSLSTTNSVHQLIK